MKRLLSLFLVIVMLASLLVSCGKKNKKDDPADNPSDAVTDPSEEANPEAGLTVTPTDMILSVGEKRKLSTNYIPKYNSDSTVLTFKTSDSAIAGVDTDGTVVAIKSGTATITVKDAKGDFTATCLVTVLGTSTTLQGSIHLPPIDSQGSLGTCAHESVTYAQFTIAVSQYINSKDPDSGWNPSSGELRYIFSPKFTYNFAAAGTEYAYNILVDHGCLTEEHSRFYHVGDATTSGPATAPYKETASWDVGKGLTELALNYRLTGYEEIDYTGTHSGNLTVGGEANLKLFNRVKAAVTDGNAVVICGWSSYWEYGSLSKSGDIGKKGEGCITMAANGPSSDGNHAVTIVGYDDNVEAQVGGITLKGAFQVMNSWGTGYQNDGFVWMMYDAFNQTSEFEILNDYKNISSLVFSLSEEQRFLRLTSTKNNFLLDFTAVGETTLNGKNYKTYTLLDSATNCYVGYDSNGKLTSVPSNRINAFIHWAVVPYADICKGTPAEGYEDAVVLYACQLPGAGASGNCFLSVKSASNSQTDCQLTSADADYKQICMFISENVNTTRTEFTSAIQLAYSKVNNSTKGERTSTIYRFSFTDWRKDIEIGVPGLRVEVEVSTTTRENFKLDLLRVDASGNIVEHRPWLFYYGAESMHDEFMGEGVRNKLSFSGAVEPTEAESGFFTLRYGNMSAYAEKNDYENYLWGVRITGNISYIKNLKLIAPDGKTLSQISLLEEYNYITIDEETRAKGTKEYFFDLGKELHTFANDGKFYMKNKATGKYLGYRATLFKETTIDGSMDMLFNFTTDPKTGKFVLYDHETQTRLDIYQKEVAEGTVVKMNNYSPNRGDTQDWTLVSNDDGSVSFRLTAYPEYYFSYDPQASGLSKYVLTKDKNSDNCKWILEGAGTTRAVHEITFSGTTANIVAPKPDDYQGTGATLRVTAADGSLVSETAVTFQNGSAKATVSGLKSGQTYMFVLTDGNKDIGVNTIITCP